MTERITGGTRTPSASNTTRSCSTPGSAGSGGPRVRADQEAVAGNVEEVERHVVVAGRRSVEPARLLARVGEPAVAGVVLDGHAGHAGGIQPACAASSPRNVPR